MLENYFREHHLFKLGLRFFMGKSQGPIEERPEAGISLFPPLPSYQIDRGRLENDLRQMIEDMRAILFEGTVIEDIHLAEGDEHHIITCRRQGNKAGFRLTGKWVVDALGRRRFLQGKLGLKRAHAHKASAAWWRYDAPVDVDDLAISKDAQRWRSSNIEKRYFSTNHLTNTGYWVWLIPLRSGSTSVGIVTDETIYPQNTYGRSYAMALDWLSRNEPGLWKFIRDKQPIGFISLKNYSYASAQVYSHKRWCCVGEAGFFLDPLYSGGSDFIAIGNTITIELIRRDCAGELTEGAVDRFNRFVLDILYKIFLDFYQGTYCTLGHAQIFTPKLTWDTAIVWAFIYQAFFQGLTQNPSAEVFVIGERYRELNQRVQRLFADWSKKASPREIYVRGDMTRMHFLQLLHLDLEASRTPKQTLDIMQKNLDRFEELAQVLFWQAVQECHPEHPSLQKRPWINAWQIVLDPEKWSEQRLFETTTIPRSLSSTRDNFTGIFARQSRREFLFHDLVYHILHWRKGFAKYHIIPLIRKRFIANKPSMWLRRFFVRDYPSRSIQEN